MNYQERRQAVLAQLEHGPQRFKELMDNLAQTAPLGAQTLVDVLADLVAEKMVARRAKPSGKPGVAPFEYYLTGY